MANPNILSLRYASPRINEIFSEEGRIKRERNLWLAVMKAQRKLGLGISDDTIEKYERARDDINLERIREIELETRHDVKAKIDAYNEAAGVKPEEQQAHRGLTSRDLDDNVWQSQIKEASGIVFGKAVSMLRHFLDKALEYKDTVISARTHMQPAQLTTLGRRMSMWAEELKYHLSNFETLYQGLPLRGIKGPVGTQFDMLTQLGSQEKVDKLEEMVAAELGFSKTLNSPGQVYPRSLDYALISGLSLLGSAPESFSKTMRVMARGELVTEGFKEGQVGSSSLPHKMNTRSSERICSMAEALKMYSDGASRISGDQWEEGDVSDSLLRRVIIPDSFYTADGLCETTLTILNEMGTYPEVIRQELDKYLPFLATTEILMAATDSGIGREEAHKIIKENAVAAALDMRAGKEPQLAHRLAANLEFSSKGLTEGRINGMLLNREHFIGLARQQIDAVISDSRYLLNKYQKEAAYEPGEIL